MQPSAFSFPCRLQLIIHDICILLNNLSFNICRLQAKGAREGVRIKGQTDRIYSERKWSQPFIEYDCRSMNAAWDTDPASGRPLVGRWLNPFSPAHLFREYRRMTSGHKPLHGSLAIWEWTRVKKSDFQTLEDSLFRQRPRNPPGCSSHNPEPITNAPSLLRSHRKKPSLSPAPSLMVTKNAPGKSRAIAGCDFPQLKAADNKI